MNNKNSTTSTTRRPDCVTEVCMGGTILVVSGYFKQDTTATAADKRIKVLGPRLRLVPDIATYVQVGQKCVKNGQTSLQRAAK